MNSVPLLVIITGVSYKKYRKTLGKRAKRHHILYGYTENGDLYVKESHDLKHSLENSKRKSGLGSFVQRVAGLFKRLIIKEKK